MLYIRNIDCEVGFVYIMLFIYYYGFVVEDIFFLMSRDCEVGDFLGVGGGV